MDTPVGRALVHLDLAQYAKRIDCGDKEAAGRGAKKVRPSEINHGNIAPSVEPLGVTCAYAEHRAVLTLAGLWRLPERRAGEARLDVLGGGRDSDGAFTFTWPIWRDPISLAAIRALLGHPNLNDPATRVALGVVDRQRTSRISFGRYMNFTRAESVSRSPGTKPARRR